MGLRITGISTPFGGIDWEYVDKEKGQYISTGINSPNQKVKVFISSVCGDNGKFDRVRTELRKTIEATNLAEVYLFEDEGASTLSAKEHYEWALEDSDICIFLIDNAIGVTPGVQNEIDTVRRCNIKALYYFCDETVKEKTPLEQSLMGASHAKSKVVHRFDDLGQNGAQELINDIVTIYLNYCRGRLLPKPQDIDEEICATKLPEIAIPYVPSMPKIVVKNIDRCKDYILKMTVGFSTPNIKAEKLKTSKIDEWGEQFLTVLFEAKSIKNFNTGLFLDELKKLQDEIYFSVVNFRWQAIQAYFLGNIDKCSECLEEALKQARETSQPTWVIQDILIDLRNIQYTHNIINNCFSDSLAQKELDKMDESVNYPVLDRINECLHEKYIEGLYKEKTKSPYTITIGNDCEQYGSLLASSYIVEMYNGSLTHLLLYYDKIRDFMFYLCCRYDNWRFRKDLLKLAIFSGKEKEIKGIQDSYPEILNEMNEKNAIELMEFCSNHPMQYRRISSQLLAFGTIGYYLSDSDFEKYEHQIIKTIREWLDDQKSIMVIGQTIFPCLSGIAYRMSQDILAEICCTFIDKHYSRWYADLFKLIAKRLDINEMSAKYAQSLVQHIIIVLEDEQERKTIKYAPFFLCVLRNQNQEATELLDEKIAEYLPEFYNGEYKLETSTNKQKDFPKLVNEYIEQIERSNEEQGKRGLYFAHGTRSIATLQAVLLDDRFVGTTEIMDSMISAVANTLLVSKEGIDIKLDAVSLLICVIIKYPEDYKRNLHIFKNIIEHKSDIEDVENILISSNIDKVSLKIALALLCISMGEEGYIDFLEGMSCIQNNTATSISVTNTIINFLEIDEDAVLPANVETVIIQNTLQWLEFDFLDMKWNATRILLMLSRNSENANLINQKIDDLVDNESVYIKNLILRQINETKGIFERTKTYVLSKCEMDPCYVVRKVCEEVKAHGPINSHCSQV